MLIAPEEYFRLDSVNKAIICNGCGRKGGIVIPSNFIEACNIHDYMYFAGKTQEDKITADEVFLKNMKTICKEKNFFLYVFAYAYYFCVKFFGNKAFYLGK